MSVIVTVSISYPSSGVTVTVTLEPFVAESLSTLTLPFSIVLSAVISFLEDEEPPPPPDDELPPEYEESLLSEDFFFQPAYTVVSSSMAVAKSNSVVRFSSLNQPRNLQPAFEGFSGLSATPPNLTSCAFTSVPPFVLNVTLCLTKL